MSTHPGRITWSRYAMHIAHAVATRSEDPYVKVGAVVLREDHTVASVGYNGAPPGIEIDWTDRDARRKRVVHAEANALRLIKPNEGFLLAVTMMPCLECLKTAASYGIKLITYDNDPTANYDGEEILTIAKEFQVRLLKVS